MVFNNMGHARKLKQMRLCPDSNAGPGKIATILLVLSSFCVCIIICCLGAMKIEGSIEEMISNLFPNFDLYFEGVNANCDPEHVLNANRRSRYEQFHFIHSNCARKH